MKLASFIHQGVERHGIIRDAGVVILDGHSSLRDCLADGPEGYKSAVGREPDVGLDEVSLLPPITNPFHLLAIGLNTHSHMQETVELLGRSPDDGPDRPWLFTRSPFSQVGADAELWAPKASSYFDYEGEIAIVIGKGGRAIPLDTALDHVAGYALYNEGSVRDYQMHSTQVTAGKNFPQSGSFGPWITTTDEAGPAEDLTFETIVNGETRQRFTMDDLIFGFPELISYVSEIFALQPGDVIVTGSPAGIGALSGPKFLTPGDVVEVTSPQLGTLRNTVVAEP